MSKDPDLLPRSVESSPHCRTGEAMKLCDVWWCGGYVIIVTFINANLSDSVILSRPESSAVMLRADIRLLRNPKIAPII